MTTDEALENILKYTDDVAMPYKIRLIYIKMNALLGLGYELPEDDETLNNILTVRTDPVEDELWRINNDT